MLPELTSVVLSAEGVRRAVHGRELGPADWTGDPTGIGIRGSGLTIGSESKSQIPNHVTRSFGSWI